MAAYLVSEYSLRRGPRTCIKHFFQGALGLRVDYATRTYSHCYAAGTTTGGSVLIASPIAFLVGVGVFIGWLIWGA